MTSADLTKPAADCHVHVFDPNRFPYHPRALYRPGAHETATVEQLVGVLDAHGVSHALVVHPTSGYGSDTRVTIDAIARYPARLRGIAVFDADVSEAVVARHKAAGFVGARVDLLTRGVDFLRGPGRRLLGILREQDMILQVQTENELLESIADVLIAEAGTLVIDHMGRPNPEKGTGQAGFRALLRLADRPSTAVKLSGPFRFSKAGYPYTDADDYAMAVLDAFGPERCVWGSDWPYVQMRHRVDYGPSLAALARWVPDLAARRKILWTTPKRLFGFADPA